MFNDQMCAVLSEPVIVRFTTIQASGYPHTVPIWFMLDGDDLIMFTSRASRKTQNIMENNKANVAIGGDPVGSPSYFVEGDVVIEDDPEHVITARITHHYEDLEKATEYLTSWEGEDFVILRLKPKRVVKIS